MSVEVVMPQMGESITEGTVSKWLKKVGDTVEKDEPILEISTDKVDAEVPAPAAGLLSEIKVQEGETVGVGTVVAVIGAEVSSDAAPAVSSQVADELQARSEEIEAQPAEETSPSATVAVAENISSGEATEIVMPQMGESITEGTVSKWLKAVGDAVEKDEPLLEISTDKVDAEVPSPVAGKLLEIRVREGETVEVGAVVGLVGSTAGISASAPQTVNQPATETPEPQEMPKTEEPKPSAAEIKVAAAGAGNGQQTADKRQMTVEDLRRTKSSPLVRNIAKKHGIDISRIAGSGLSGRVTKKDILNFIETGAALRPQDLLVGKTSAPIVSAPSVVSSSMQTQKTAVPSPQAAVGDRVEPMSVMRRKIAEHMVFSKQTSAHVTSVYEIDMTNVAKFREKNKAVFQERFGTKLTFMPFIFQAVNKALREYPVVNAQVSGDNIIYKSDINLGMAVALDWGLIVPVIKKADTLSLSGLAIAANDLADRARAKKLLPDEVQGGTFTITNPGVFGGLFGTPIINQPQVAILCVGTIEKRPRVLTTPDGDDYIAIRQMAYFALTYDHRIVDGADAEKFLSFLKNYLETTQFSL